ncbi:RNA polymerase i-associated factor PAF67 domain-containing protein [Ditylenchus destructor]|uniref:Eukaryotic translation initiation factor 3 subunit L n=1 Tax=Ditylenchus destructor TaxID=166010 RepID=A0AAD4ND76_9BILA|nr:RNA polymerase i-associated factor PAF67 domain-containing protein [Ditylenchus destructor]
MAYSAYSRGAHTGDPERDLAFEREGRGVDLPEEVVQYLQYFRKMIELSAQQGSGQLKTTDVNPKNEIQGLYEHGFADLTERYFTEKTWPNESVVERVVGGDNRLFIVLYKELYFRDLYTRMSRSGPSLDNRYNSYMNYQELFAEILNQANNQPVNIQLPNLWLWDIIDEFVYQFQAFCLYKANPSKRKPEEDEYLAEIEQSQNAWNIYPVLNILYSLLEKSQINDQLKAIRDGANPDDVADEFGRSPLYFGLGYFSLIGLLRTHVLLGDYHQALQTVEFLEMDTKGLYNNVPSCLVTLHYFVGFSHMMMRNYGEATKIFVNCLLYIQRTQNLHQQQSQQKKNTKYDVIGKTNEQLFHLLAICLTLQPQRIDESIQSQLYEKSGDRMSRMAKGDIDEFRNAFQQGCPKFLSPTTVAYCNGHNLAKEPLNRQCNAFLEGIESQIYLPILRGYLKLYTTLPLKKLATFMKVPEPDLDSFVGKLLAFKMIVNELGKETIERDIVDDSNTDLDFYIDGDMINIADTKVARRIGEYFIKNIVKLKEIQEKVKRLPV